MRTDLDYPIGLNMPSQGSQPTTLACAKTENSSSSRLRLSRLCSTVTWHSIKIEMAYFKLLKLNFWQIIQITLSSTHFACSVHFSSVL